LGKSGKKARKVKNASGQQHIVHSSMQRCY